MSEPQMRMTVPAAAKERAKDPEFIKFFREWWTGPGGSIVRMTRGSGDPGTAESLAPLFERNFQEILELRFESDAVLGVDAGQMTVTVEDLLDIFLMHSLMEPRLSGFLIPSVAI